MFNNLKYFQILTKDSVTVFVNAVMYYRVADAETAVNEVDDYAESAKFISSTTLRNVLGTKTLGEILSDTVSIAQDIKVMITNDMIKRFHQIQIIPYPLKAELDLATIPWGVLVERVEIKDVSVPEQLQRAMASTAEAAREARAKVIAAEGELQASRSLAHAADVIVDCPEALQVEHIINANVNSSIDSYILAITFVSNLILKVHTQSCITSFMN